MGPIYIVVQLYELVATMSKPFEWSSNQNPFWDNRIMDGGHVQTSGFTRPAIVSLVAAVKTLLRCYNDQRTRQKCQKRAMVSQ